TGSYWGGLGEQIDTRSGNLNFSLPLLTALSRGSNLKLGLSYNSQNLWEDASGSDWNLGQDVGYGYGWKLQIGSLTPYYDAVSGNLSFYLLEESTGAQYHL